MLTLDRLKRIAASLCHESLSCILYIIWSSLTNPEITSFLHQRYTKLCHGKVWNIQTREVNAAFSLHNVAGFKGYLPPSPSSDPVQMVWNDNQAEIIYMSSTRGVKHRSNYIYFRFQSFPFLYLCLECCAYVYVCGVGACVYNYRTRIQYLLHCFCSTRLHGSHNCLPV